MKFSIYLNRRVFVMSTHNLCFERKYEKYQSFLSENFQFLEVKFSIYLNRHVFVMDTAKSTAKSKGFTLVQLEHYI